MSQQMIGDIKIWNNVPNEQQKGGEVEEEKCRFQEHRKIEYRFDNIDEIIIPFLQIEFKR